MHLQKILRLAGIAVWALLVGAGCTTPSRSVSVSNATTPQDKVHEDQLAEMRRKDAETATEPSLTQPKRPAAARDRRSGQRVIDQPRRR